MISPEVRAAILEDMVAPNSDISRVSRQYGIPIRLIRDVLSDVLPAPARHNETNNGLGRPEMQRFRISRTPAGHTWPSMDGVAIRRAHKEYDAGLIEIATGRDGDWMILYRIPRRHVDKNRRPYFSRVFE